MNKIPPDSPAGNYLSNRGLLWNYVAENFAARLTDSIDMYDEEFQRDVLGWKTGDDFESDGRDKGIDHTDNPEARYRYRKQSELELVEEILSIPILDFEGNPSWVSRFFPDPQDKKFRVKTGTIGPIFIPPLAWDARKEIEVPLCVTEGPVKAMKLCHAGVPAIGLNGTWGAGYRKEDGEKVELHPLLARFAWRKRKVYFAFDNDQVHNGDVRRGIIRAWILLSVRGAEVYQLDWWGK